MPLIFVGGVPKFLSPNPPHTDHPIPHQDAVAKTERQELPELEWFISLHLLHLHFSWNLRPGGERKDGRRKDVALKEGGG